MTDTLKTVQALVHEIAKAAFDEGVAHGKGAKNFCGSNGKVPALIDALIAQMQREAAQPEPSAQGPAELWIQLHGDTQETGLPVDYTGDDVTWCWHQINDSDVRYVRADLVAPAQPAQAQYPLPDDLYPGSKDWQAADYAGRVEWLHCMYESASKAALSDEEIEALAFEHGDTIIKVGGSVRSIEFTPNQFRAAVRAILARAGIGESRHE